MACPTCDGTMANLYLEPQRGIGQMALFHCDRCGTVKKVYREMADENKTYVPSLITRLKQFRLGLSGDQRQAWDELGIEECILLPENRMVNQTPPPPTQRDH